MWLEKFGQHQGVWSSNRTNQSKNASSRQPSNAAFPFVTQCFGRREWCSSAFETQLYCKSKHSTQFTMGDGKASTRTSLSSSSAPRTNYRRTNRFGARTAVRSFAISRTPIVLELDSQVLRVGYSEQTKPQHTLLLNDTFSLNQNLTESQWYNLLSPILMKVYDRLMCNPTSRRVVCLLPHLAPSNMTAALKQLLWNKGVPAVVVWSNLEILPVAQGWKRGLIVQVSKNETVSVCHADGHVLPFTYQNVPAGYDKLLSAEDKNKITTAFTPEMEQLMLNENSPNSIVVAVLKTLEECPRDIRPFCASNIVFCGEGVVLFPDIARRVTQRIKAILEGNQTPLDLVFGDDKNALLTTVPVQLKSLLPLASKLNLNSTQPYRPDWISWVGASLWAAVWNKYDDEESPIKWTVAPSEK